MGIPGRSRCDVQSPRLTSQPANARRNGPICAIASSEVPSSGCYRSWQCAQPSSSGFGAADFLTPIERGSAPMVASFPRAVGGETMQYRRTTTVSSDKKGTAKPPRMRGGDSNRVSKPQIPGVFRTRESNTTPRFVPTPISVPCPDTPGHAEPCHDVPARIAAVLMHPDGTDFIQKAGAFPLQTDAGREIGSWFVN